MPFAVNVQTTATVVVAVIGLLSTLLAAVLTHRQDTAAERGRWLRDRRADVYFALTAAYLKGKTFMDDWEKAQAELASIQTQAKAATKRVKEVKATKVKPSGSGVDADRRSTLEALVEQAAELDSRREKVEATVAELDLKLPEHLGQLEDLLMPLDILSSPRVKSLGSAVQDELARLLAGLTKGIPPDTDHLYVKWALLHEAMRRDLGVSNRRSKQRRWHCCRPFQRR